MPFEKFCPKCGKKTEELINGFCPVCAETKKDSMPASIKVHYCNCTRIREKGRWVQYNNIDEAIRSIIKNCAKIKHIEIEYPSVLFSGKVTLPVTIKSHDNHIINIIFIQQCCDVCSRKSGNYYEGNIQIRGNLIKAEDIKDYILEKTEQYKDKYENCFLLDIGSSKHGFDMKFGSGKAIKKIIREMKNNFNINIKETFEMYGLKDGNHLSRKTIAIRINE